MTMTASYLFQSLMELKNLWQEGYGAEKVKEHLIEIYPRMTNPLDAILYFTESYDCKFFPEMLVGTFTKPAKGSFEEIVVLTFNFWFCNSQEPRKFNSIVQRVYAKLQV